MLPGATLRNGVVGKDGAEDLPPHILRLGDRVANGGGIDPDILYGDAQLAPGPLAPAG